MRKLRFRTAPKRKESLTHYDDPSALRSILGNVAVNLSDTTRQRRRRSHSLQVEQSSKNAEKVDSHRRESTWSESRMSLGGLLNRNARVLSMLERPSTPASRKSQKSRSRSHTPSLRTLAPGRQSSVFLPPPTPTLPECPPTPSTPNEQDTCLTPEPSKTIRLKRHTRWHHRPRVLLIIALIVFLASATAGLAVFVGLHHADQ